MVLRPVGSTNLVTKRSGYVSWLPCCSDALDSDSYPASTNSLRFLRDNICAKIGMLFKAFFTSSLTVNIKMAKKIKVGAKINMNAIHLIYGFSSLKIGSFYK